MALRQGSERHPLIPTNRGKTLSTPSRDFPEVISVCRNLIYNSRMKMNDIPFGITDWSQVPVSEHPGETGSATWKTCEFGSTRVRMVEYSPGYLADHWCNRGHILLVLEGALTTELANGEVVTVEAGSSYQVGNDVEAHRSSTREGVRLFIVD
ncbi:DHCW motif cupin fold protein [Streptomyces sp. RKAG293]|uniref:DHCW motif cupin fold protein n=1 Tax=Streptomyces sp. RKAG293 TaxID=2893403 RepID=UPI00203412CE|nr:DHCW motif cupin fold protein [Streptomyces sp. RKAG293]MCM2416531.1 DHCW motif cupin fold protein [Streptomyces sp. RKAG293]